MYNLGTMLNLDGLGYSNPTLPSTATGSQIPPKYYMYSENANCIALYWTGL